MSKSNNKIFCVDEQISILEYLRVECRKLDQKEVVEGIEADLRKITKSTENLCDRLNINPKIPENDK